MTGYTPTHLLIDEPPLLVPPQLAVMIGLNECLVLQQVHFWLRNRCTENNIHEGRRWVFNPYTSEDPSKDSWQTNFPFWGVRTIKRIFASLESKGLLISGNFNTKKWDQTKWYTIDYQKVGELEDDIRGHSALGQGGTMDSAYMARPIPETTQRLTRKRKEEKRIEEEAVLPFQLVVGTSEWEGDIRVLVDLLISPVAEALGVSSDGDEVKAFIEHMLQEQLLWW